MRVALPKKDLSKAVSLLNRVIDRNSRKLKLGFHLVKLKAEFDKRLELAGTNGEVYLTLKASINEVIEEGEVCVEATALLKAIQSIKTEYVELYTEEEKLVIKTNNSIQKLALKPVEHFPDFPEPRFQNGIWAPILMEGIEKVSFAVATEKQNTMEVLRYIYVDGRGDHTNIVASDGHRLAVQKFETYQSNIKLKLYYKSLKLLKELLKNALRIEVGSDGDFVFLSGKILNTPKNFSLKKVLDNLDKLQNTDIEWTIAIRDFSEADYPDYDAVVPPPETYDVVLEILIEDLNNALENFAQFNSITFEFTDTDGFKIKARDIEGNESEAWVKADVYGDASFSIDFVPKQLKEFTEIVKKIYPERYIEARFKDDDMFPALFKVNDNYFYLVMPIIRKKR